MFFKNILFLDIKILFDEIIVNIMQEAIYINKENDIIHNLKDENIINENPKLQRKQFLEINEPKEINYSIPIDIRQINEEYHIKKLKKNYINKVGNKKKRQIKRSIKKLII